MSKYEHNSIGSLHVSNLRPDVTEAMLFNKFSDIGPIISIRLMRDKTTRQSLGFAYVNFERRTNAEDAMDKYDSTYWNNQILNIKWNKPVGNLKNFTVNNIFIKNLDRSVDNKTLYNIFIQFGEIVSCKVARNDQGTSKGFGYIQFQNEESINSAIEMCNDIPLLGRNLIVEKFIPRDERLTECIKRISLTQIKMNDGVKNKKNQRNNKRNKNNNNNESADNNNFINDKKIQNNLLCNVPNIHTFNCPLCNKQTDENKGIRLNDCRHTFCIECMIEYLHNKGGAGQLPCPNSNNIECLGYLQANEINNLVTNYKMNIKLNSSKILSDSKTYNKLLELENTQLISATKNFECIICFDNIEPINGVMLRACLHEFCKTCLINLINNSEDVTEISCPFVEYKCDGILEPREIQELLPEEDYNKYLDNTLKHAELRTTNSYHCKAPNCGGWWEIEQLNVVEVYCPVCNALNCLECKKIHPRYSCSEWADKLLASDDTVQERVTTELIQNMILNKNAMKCSQCQAIVEKIDGCDAIVCSICKTELCWATKGPRWGPKGKGDLTGGCRCGVNSIKCTPTCNFCH